MCGLYALYKAIFSLELFKCAYVSRCISNKVNRDLSLFVAPGLCFFQSMLVFCFFWGGGGCKSEEQWWVKAFLALRKGNIYYETHYNFFRSSFILFSRL